MNKFPSLRISYVRERLNLISTPEKMKIRSTDRAVGSDPSWVSLLPISYALCASRYD